MGTLKIKAKFIGGTSHGYVSGKIYTVKFTEKYFTPDVCGDLRIYDMDPNNGGTPGCEYQSMRAFLQNWILMDCELMDGSLYTNQFFSNDVITKVMTKVREIKLRSLQV